MDPFDVIVIGAGHAGCEAALASARASCRTLLLTQNIETIGQMSCNPAIGGIGKGHLVKEIDALDGAMAKAADRAGIHFRILNSRKGAAVRATRAQADRMLYKMAMRAILEETPNLHIFQQEVVDLFIEHGQVKGVLTQFGLAIKAQAVVLTAGTFLRGKIHIGLANDEGGRAGDKASIPLADRLREIAPQGRLKTGTPPRIDGKTIDYTLLTEQPGDMPTPVFSYMGIKDDHPAQTLCWITATTEKTHEIIRGALDRSPLYTGVIEGIGPRYCPSIEDKVVRFADKTSHQIFVEPEGLNTHEIYPNGISTSLPFDIQEKMVRSIKGFANVVMTRPGYAIEYDFFDPRHLKPSLETKGIAGLFFAGQINGTTGYEEAAAQGLMAGLNAARYVKNEAPFFFKRHEAYIGVLIDDLVTRGVSEPYRMFTSRAEYRLNLREDNADFRLTPIGRELGIVGEQRWCFFAEKMAKLQAHRQRLASWRYDENPNLNFLDLLRRPDWGVQDILGLINEPLEEEILQILEIELKYEGYIRRQSSEIERVQQYEHLRIDHLDFASIRGLSTEVRQKLAVVRPYTLAQASRMDGITPAAIALILVHLKKKSA